MTAWVARATFGPSHEGGSGGVGFAEGLQLTVMVTDDGTTGALIGSPESLSRAVMVIEMVALPAVVPCNVNVTSSMLVAPAETMLVRSAAVSVTEAAGSAAGSVWFRVKTG